VLFSASGQPNACAPFDLWYFDELARQEAPIKLTIDPNAALARDIDNDPPLELVLATKWPGCSVDWNGAEKIL